MIFRDQMKAALDDAIKDHLKESLSGLMLSIGAQQEKEGIARCRNFMMELKTAHSHMQKIINEVFDER